MIVVVPVVPVKDVDSHRGVVQVLPVELDQVCGHAGCGDGAVAQRVERRCGVPTGGGFHEDSYRCPDGDRETEPGAGTADLGDAGGADTGVTVGGDHGDEEVTERARLVPDQVPATTPCAAPVVCTTVDGVPTWVTAGQNGVTGADSVPQRPSVGGIAAAPNASAPSPGTAVMR